MTLLGAAAGYDLNRRNEQYDGFNNMPTKEKVISGLEALLVGVAATTLIMAPAAIGHAEIHSDYSNSE